ncbi:unnamed protein product [Thlaspi arvense]|uniref:Fungal lipase-type domain-containing protein n=1 Tax=Thlaspi arvense TaxID=13288 RepID=A0AAU9SXK8_THLAR|nr:unnamed protein product [Thlaspi arvense]
MMWMYLFIAFLQNMGQKRWLCLLAIFACLLSFSCGRVLKLKGDDVRPVYNHTLAITLVEYASAVYMSDLTELFNWTCERCNGLTKGFEVLEIIFDVEHCLQAYVGVAKNLNAIIIAFRGTQEHSIQNWVSDLFWKQLDLNYPDMPDAMVHHGFYSAYHNTTVRPAVLSAVQRAKISYGANINIIVTGHSMGGAMATFCGLDLVVNEGEENVQVMTFGQPRVGNADFASYYSLLVPNTFRITHEHDMVPHLPPYYFHFPQKTYHHFPTEVWVRDLSFSNLVLLSMEQVCDNTGEDPTCSRSVVGNSISDHLRYFGVDLKCESWRQCTIVMSNDHEMERFSKKDSKGNLLLSRTVPSTDINGTKTIGSLEILDANAKLANPLNSKESLAENDVVEFIVLLQNMGQKRCFFLLSVFACLLFLSHGRVLNMKRDDGRPVYNHTLALTLVEYTSAVYMSDLTELFTWTCERCNGLTKGFQVIEIIVDIQHCLQGYVGVAKDLNAIVIAFRGTQEHSIQNWVSDLFWKQLDLNYPDMPDAMVHHGFYSAYHNTTVRPAVLGAVRRAKEYYGANINIMVTGHSMGGAMAAFCGLDLVVNEGEENVQVMTFGQPRVGNAAFASYYSLLVPNTFRITHDRDIVPHLPPYFYLFPQKTYHHFPTEVWVRDLSVLKLVHFGVEKVCDKTGEDPTCCRSVMGSSISDHLWYFGVEMMCETWRQCSIVMSPEIESYSRKDSKGNVFLSRTIPSTKVIETKTLSKTGVSSL